MLLPRWTGRSFSRRFPRFIVGQNKIHPAFAASISSTTWFLTAAHHHQQQPCWSQTAGSKMSFHFGSSEYASCFSNLPNVDTKALRETALASIQSFDRSLWYQDPVSPCFLCFGECRDK